MKTRIVLIGLVTALLAGCRAVASGGDDVVRLIGDDVGRIASQNGDDLAKTAKQYANTVPEQSQISDEAVRYWDEILHSSQSMDDSARTLLYQSDNLSPLQANLVSALRSEVDLSEDEALLYLETVCSVAAYIEYFGKYPETSFAEFYVEQAAEKYGIQVLAIQDFADSAQELAITLVEGTEAESLKQAAGFVFEGLCLVTSSD